ncbi:hypothetical protein F4775DRAFT_586672 [Biscogniauxia sp. FL1348]|nr:hypothetical protein F4775DRAFT_586672 [Biscogniauxia sp. FL1348]
MADDDPKRREDLARWYAALSSRHVDIVGDYGGKELFLIHGDSLILHCISSSRVDFEDGFQLLHAIFAVETFLGNLKSRGCNFRIAFFDDHQELCIPSTTPKNRRYKYLLTRTILVQHLQRFMNDETDDHPVLCFPSCSSTAFASWLARNAILFLLCHDGHALVQCPSGEQEMFLYMIHQFLRNEYSIGIIHSVDIQSSRVFSTMITHAPTFHNLPPVSVRLKDDADKNNLDIVDYGNITYLDISLREQLTIAIVSKLLRFDSSEDSILGALALVIQTAVMRLARLSERSLDAQSPTMSETAVEKANQFMELFCREATLTLNSCAVKSQLHDAHWDLFDFFDGRLFLHMYSHLSEGRPLIQSVINEGKRLATYVEQHSGVKLIQHEQFPALTELSSTAPSPLGVIQASVLPFNLPALDEFLEPIKLDIVDDISTYDESRVFSELSHWHNARRLLDPKRVLQKPGFFARKRTQRFMADTLAYSASLTNATGKLIDPEVIIKTKANISSGVASHPGIGSEPAPPNGREKTGKKVNQSTQKGKAKAQEEARERQHRRDEQKISTALSNWKARSQEFNTEPDQIKRFLKATRLFHSLKREHTIGVKAEVSLYLVDLIYKAWVRRPDSAQHGQDLEIAALLFKHCLETCKMPGLTLEISEALRAVGIALKISISTANRHTLISRPLCFPLSIGHEMTPKKIPGNPIDFQLQYCGPYLERSFDSQRDPRVPFDPDAWQRTVLDGIDENKSLFIVAPTSSGKTFISFYAMKKVLQADDDGVLVYVAPTKALVNQIAAEIQARFQKSYDRPGRSVWAIHTRDYRVNNPTGCQVLVTVPHVLQIMLLAPSNADGPNSWSRRVKRIIFDEVHCIGQADDGLIWEQLLLMAPCPIIALSATVGNPREFYEWLRASQKSKGFELELIQHHSRYSDLRAFFHVRPKTFEFNGLSSYDGFPVPGLDRTGSSGSFRFIHPIAATINRVGFDLDEIILEPRDAFTLWSCMKKKQTRDFPINSSLDPPSGAPEGILSKSDVLEWTQKLKSTLNQWMKDTKSPFQQIRAELGKSTLHREEDSQSRTNTSDQPSEDHKAFKEAKLIGKSNGTSVLPLLVDLRREDGLPAILFNYDRVKCECALDCVLSQLKSAEITWKQSSKEWAQHLKKYELWKVRQAKRKPAKDSRKLSKDERMQEEANVDVSPWESFDPDEPHPNFSFADNSKLAKSEFNETVKSLDDEHIPLFLFEALERGLGVHHAGMNRRYRQVVEMLFRKGFLTTVIATGTLALGINMPCKTVVFFGDSAYLTSLAYRQASGRAGRRGFDLLGNVVFSDDIRPRRAFELMSSRLPDLKGHFPLSTTLVLRILGLVAATTSGTATNDKSDFAVDLFKCLLSHNRLYLGGPEAKMAVRHHLRFSIEYLRRQHLLSADGKPLNFAGLIGHLYFTENAAFAFHSLLKGGYFGRLCSQIDKDRTATLRTLVMVMAHLFNRVSVASLRKYSPEVDITTSWLVLPRLPEDAERLLIRHNEETLQIFKSYAASYIENTRLPPDRHLPLTGIAVGSENPGFANGGLGLPGALPPPTLRSPFAALSGRTDSFESIRDLCSDIRSGVFLEESVVPHIRIWPHDKQATPLNAYLYNFFITGDYAALTRDNRIKKGDVWFLLKDFSLVLATLVASLTNFVRPDGESGGAGMDDVDILNAQEAAETPDEGGYNESEQAADIDRRPGTSDNLYQTARASLVTTSKKVNTKAKKGVVLDSWEDDIDTASLTDDNKEDGPMWSGSQNSLQNNTPSSLSSLYTNTSHPLHPPSPTLSSRTPYSPEWAPEKHEEGNNLVNVLRAFTILKMEFDEKFKKTWA